MVNQYNYSGFTLIPSEKKHVAVDNLINKGRKACFLIQKMQIQKSKYKTADTYFKLFVSIVKPIERWGDALNTDPFADKIEKVYLGMLNQILGVNKISIKVKWDTNV